MVDHALPLFDNSAPAAGDDDATRRLPPPGALQAAGGDIRPPPAPLGSGQIVRLAWPLLALLARLAAGGAPADPEHLKMETARLIRRFDRAALGDGMAPDLVSAARYMLCTAIDEAITLADPAAAAMWARGSLLGLFHNETWGGEKVFAMAERALAEPDRFIDLLELCHLILLLGFQGRFRRERDGTAKVDALRARIFDALGARRGGRPVFPAAVTPVLGRRPGGKLVHYVPVWPVAVVCLLISAVIFTWFDYRLQTEVGQVAAAIADVSGMRPGGQ